MRKGIAALALALTLAVATVAPVFADAGNITPCQHGAALPGVFGALYGSGLDASQQAHDNQPLGATISGFAQQHADPGAGDCN
jgi:uncharacterized protein (DUF697 family)